MHCELVTTVILSCLSPKIDPFWATVETCSTTWKRIWVLMFVACRRCGQCFSAVWWLQCEITIKIETKRIRPNCSFFFDKPLTYLFALNHSRYQLSCHLQVKSRLWSSPCRGHPAWMRMLTTVPSSNLEPRSLRGSTVLMLNQVVMVWVSPSSRRPGGSSNSEPYRSEGQSLLHLLLCLALSQDNHSFCYLL